MLGRVGMGRGCKELGFVVEVIVVGVVRNFGLVFLV